MLLPDLETKKWEDEIKFYQTSTKAEREKRAKELGFANSNSYGTSMNTRGVHLLSPEAPPVQKTKEKILPAPVIELRPVIQHEEKEDDEIQVLLASDEQVGLKTKTYNQKVFSKRISLLYDRVLRFGDIKRKFCPVKQLNVFKLGDEVHGELIGKQVMLDELEITLRDQKWLVVNEWSNFLINASQYYETVETDCIPGNHGIMGKLFSSSTNWSLEVFDLLKAALANYPQIKINVIADDFYFIKKIKNTRFLGLHGDKIPMYLSLPFYGIDRRSLRWQQSLPPWDILTMGHFHSCSFVQPSGIPIFINGTMSSDSRFVAQWLGIKEIAEQWTFFVGNKHAITGMHKIELQKEDT